MIAVFMYLILTKRLAPTLALILVPLMFALIVTATGVGEPGEEGVVDSIMSSLKDFAPTATLLFFAIIFFGTMIDVGLFDPLIRFVLRAVGHDPVRLVVCTAVLAGGGPRGGEGARPLTSPSCPPSPALPPPRPAPPPRGLGCPPPPRVC